MITGAEELNVHACECTVDECHTRHIEDDMGYLPMDIEEYWEKKQRDYYSPDDYE